ncbi:MAG: hypothetical protein PVG98_06615 [Chromatiales bacterium]|jgi:hypothetical protein
MRHAIITAGDARAGDFIADHWARSVCSTCNLAGIDLVVLDYGLTRDQAQRMDALGVERVACARDGHPANLRFRDAARLLSERDYGNVLMTDGGDLILQADLTPLLRRPLDRVQAYREPAPSVVWSKWKGGTRVSGYIKHLQVRFSREPTVNVGVLLGPAALFRGLWAHMDRHTTGVDLEVFGVDQILISDYLLGTGYEPLDRRYNFMPWACPFGVRVAKGVVCDAQGTIPVVHNSGGYRLTRPIARFGFGPDRNRKKVVLFAIAGLFAKEHQDAA